ncbi:MAG: twin-arginine translocation signal domain-containing protein [Gemmatimonadota bacterium]|nr:twin-arginine translocation signal domain-containing protein [Gemmatimonadota bacterium]
MLDLTHSTPRRGFLAKVAASAAAIGLGSLVPRTLLSQPRSTPVAADPAYDAWLNRIAGQHKMVFDAPEPNGGMPVVWPRVWLDTTNGQYGTTDAQNRAVVVLRHGSIGFALNDAMWAKYKLGETFAVTDGAAPATRNTWLKPLPLPLPGTGIEALVSKGVLFGACNVAITVYSGAVAQGMKLDPAAVRADWMANVVPGVQVVPSGVLAVSGAQEKGCAMCFAG